MTDEELIQKCQKDLNYIVSVLEMQYVTSFEDENADGQMEEYASLDIPSEEYEAIRNKIYELIKAIPIILAEGKEQERERIIKYIENYDLFTNYSGDFRATLISELKGQALKAK